MIRHLLVILSTLVFITACGGGGGYGGGSTGGGSGGSGTGLSGGGTKGPLVSADVKLYAVDYAQADLRGAEIGAGTTNSAAKITGLSIPLGNVPPFILEFTSNAGTTDITTGQPPVISTLRTIILTLDGDPIYATPLTTMAADIAIASSPADDAALATALTAAADQVVSTVGFGMSGDIDIFNTPPLMDSTTNTEAAQNDVAAYRAAIEALTAVAFQINENGTTNSTEEVLAALTDDLADGSIDGLASGNSTGVAAANINEAFAEDPTSLVIPGTNPVITVGDIEQELTSETATTNEAPPSGNIQANEQPAQTNPNRDGDSAVNSKDAFPDDASETLDTDGDGIGNNADSDDDNDGVADTSDDFPLDPTRSNSADEDLDGDGFFGAADAFPNDASEWADFDGDQIGDNADTDDDNDQTPDSTDAFPKNAAEQIDTDRDGIGNNADNDDDNDGLNDSVEVAGNPANNNQTSEPLVRDTDGDGTGDKTDKFPRNASEQRDTDGDGTGNNADDDDDGDGRLDTAEGATCDATVTPARSKRLVADSDGDLVNDGDEVNGTGPSGKTSNPCLADTDGDGTNDNVDLFPNDGDETVDGDGDGVGDNGDNCPNDPNADQTDNNNNNVGAACEVTPQAENSPNNTTDEDTPLTGQLSAATDPEGDSLVFSQASDPIKGGVQIESSGAFTYTPSLNENGSDSFEFTVTDGEGTSDTATVSISITPVNDAPSGAVLIDDTSPAEGDTLTASNTLSDPDGDGSVSYQWNRNGSPIGGANTASYLVVADDIGSTLSVTASYTDGGGTPEAVTSDSTAPVTNVNAPPQGSVTIDNNAPAEDDLLTASNTLTDDDGLGTINYQWQRDGVDISGATANTYTVVQADVGAVITVVASYTDGQGTNEAVSSSATTAVTNVNDNPTGSVTIDNNSPAEDDTLTASNTLADEDGLGTISYQWKRDGVDIAGATSSTYTLVQADVGSVITVEASYTDGEGTPESVSSAGTAAVTNINDAPTGTVTIDNMTPTEDDTLTASNALADEDGLGTISYQWQRDGVDIAGATSSTYTLVQDDVGAVITVVASYTDGEGTPESVSSAGTAAVANVNDAPTGTVTIDNLTPAQGETLTASNTLDDEDGLGTIGYQWQRDGVDIAGATAETYTTVQDDVDAAITVTAAYIDGEGTNESVTSSATAAVTNVNDAPTGTVTIDNTTPQRTDVLTASNDLADEDGLGTINYQWKRDGVDIVNATSASYTVVQDDVGTALSVTASYDDNAGASESVDSDPTATVEQFNNAPTGSVTIDNTTPAEDQTLTASNDLQDADGLGAISYQWQRDGIDIANATSSTYTLVQADVGATMTAVASYTDGVGKSESVSSDPTAAVTNVNDDPTGTVTITGTAEEDQTLTASNDLDDEDGVGTISHQWNRAGQPIEGATAATYLLVQADVGSTITVTASYTDNEGTPESQTSAPTAAVTNVNDAPTGTVTIDNTAPTEGDTLMASNDLDDEDGLGTISYQWNRAGQPINGATGPTYTTVLDDVGSAISVTASYTDGQGMPESKTSADTAAVEAGNTGGSTLNWGNGNWGETNWGSAP